MDQNIAGGKLDVAIVGVGDADNSCLAQLWSRHSDDDEGDACWSN